MLTLSQVAFLGVSAASIFGLAQGQACARTYVVQSGDNCDTIAARQRVSTFQLLDVNKQIDANCDNLFVNEVLCLGLIGQDCTTVAVVNSGDTCTSIAVNARTSLATLFANNPNVDANCDNIRPGEVLCTAQNIIVGGGAVVSGAFSASKLTPSGTTLVPSASAAIVSA